MLMCLGIFGERNVDLYEKPFKQCLTTHIDAFEPSTGLGSSNSESIVTTEGNAECAPMQTRDF